jgi:hypothetical protein
MRYLGSYKKCVKSEKTQKWEHKIGVCWAADLILTYLKGELNDGLPNGIVYLSGAMFTLGISNLSNAVLAVQLHSSMFYVLRPRMLQSAYHPTDALRNATRMTYLINWCMFRHRGAIIRELLQTQVYKPTCQYTFCSFLWTYLRLIAKNT